MKTAIKLVLIYFVMQILAALLVMPFAMLYSYAVSGTIDAASVIALAPSMLLRFVGWATMAYHCEIHPGIISEAMGHSSITVTETYLKPFSSRKIDEANQRVISFVRSGACTV